MRFDEFADSLKPDKLDNLLFGKLSRENIRQLADSEILSAIQSW